MIKDVLYQIKENNWLPTDDDVASLLPQLLEHIGDVDDTLRDDLIYNIISKWIIDGIFDDQQKRQIVHACLHNLTIGIGENGTDTVFLRTFSVLQFPAIFYAHLKIPFLDEDLIIQIYIGIIEYFKNELDLRGYISGKGWAHAVAHTADAFKYMAKCDSLKAVHLEGILMAIHEKVAIGTDVYNFDEDERLVSAVMVIASKLPVDTMIKWVDHFKNLQKDHVLPNDSYVYLNTKNFLRSLYFRLETSDFKNHVEEALKSISRF